MDSGERLAKRYALIGRSGSVPSHTLSGENESLVRVKKLGDAGHPTFTEKAIYHPPISKVDDEFWETLWAILDDYRNLRRSGSSVEKVVLQLAEFHPYFIAMHYFFSDEPLIADEFFKRLLKGIGIAG